MLTFVSGWRGQDRDKALLKYRDPERHAVFFLDDASKFADLLPDAPVIDVWRNGVVDFQIGDDSETLVRMNYDTENSMLQRAIAHTLLTGADAQLIITYDALGQLFRLFPALRAAGAVLAANERLDAPTGDRVVFTRGGSFVWTDHILESQTALLTDSEVIDAGIVPEDADLSVDYRFRD